MAINADLMVFVPEASGSSLGEIMGKMRDWFNANRIEPRTFKTVVNGDCLAFEVHFQNENDAELFRERFAANRGASWRVAFEPVQPDP
jgi:hypothetical protein